MVDNTVLFTLPVLLFVTWFTVKQLRLYWSRIAFKTLHRWVWILSLGSAFAVPSLAALITACIGLAGAVLTILIARNYAKVTSGRNDASRMRLVALGVTVLSLIPLLVSAGLLFS